MSGSSAPSVEVEFRKVSYRAAGRDGNSTEILHSLSLTLHRGDTLVLLGRSGSGKTTALKLVNRLLEPSEGEVLVENRSTRIWDPIRLDRKSVV